MDQHHTKGQEPPLDSSPYDITTLEPLLPVRRLIMNALKQIAPVKLMRTSQALYTEVTKSVYEEVRIDKDNVRSLLYGVVEVVRSRGEEAEEENSEASGNGGKGVKGRKKSKESKERKKDKKGDGEKDKDKVILGQRKMWALSQTKKIDFVDYEGAEYFNLHNLRCNEFDCFRPYFVNVDHIRFGKAFISDYAAFENTTPCGPMFVVQYICPMIMFTTILDRLVKPSSMCIEWSTNDFANASPEEIPYPNGSDEQNPTRTMFLILRGISLAIPDLQRLVIHLPIDQLPYATLEFQALTDPSNIGIRAYIEVEESMSTKEILTRIKKHHDKDFNIHFPCKENLHRYVVPARSDFKQAAAGILHELVDDEDRQKFNNCLELVLQHDETIDCPCGND